jgi:hypothetical protein
MINTLDSSAVDPRSDQTKDYKTGISYFSSEHASKRTGMQYILSRSRRVYRLLKGVKISISTDRNVNNEFVPGYGQ